MKTLKLKRILSIALAGAMSMALATTAFAAGDETVITATFEEPEIAVTVPATVAAFINPYGVDVNYDASDDARILSATVTGAIVERTDKDTTKAMKFATAPTDGSTVTTKNAYVTFQMKVDDGIKGTAGDIVDTLYNPLAEAWAADDDADGEVIVKVGETAGADLVALKKADLSGTNPAAVAGGGALIRLNGDCVTAPKIAWDEQDSFTVTVAYTFMPTTIEEPAP